jgi:hypothetical protein
VTTDAAVPPARPGQEVRPDRLERVLGAVPLLGLFAWACLLYAWQSWFIVTPFIFTDELEFTQLARSIAETGHAARRGVAYGLPSLPVVLMAPAWLIDNVGSAYDAAKYLNVVAMTAAVFPAYGLARMVVGRRAALFAAAGTVAIPAFMYSSLLLEEPLAYFVSTLALYLLAKALATRGQWWITGAVAAAAVAPLTRSQLAVIPAAGLASLLVVAWRSVPVRRWRSRWTGADWVGGITLAALALVVFSAAMGHLSFSWLVATGYYKRRMLEYGIWAGGAFAIGLGVLPVIAGLAALARPRDEPRTPERTAFTIVLATSLLVFGLYTAVKASYISYKFSTLVVERNLIYLAPLLFVGTAMWLERPRFRPGALALATLVTGVLVLATQLRLDYPYFEAPGFAILAWANRELALPQSTLEHLLWLLLAAALGLLLLPRALAGRPALARAAVAGTAVLVLAWNVAGQSAASAGARSNADSFLAGFPEPVDWLDRADGGEPAFFLGQGGSNPNGIHLLEFWNRSLKQVWALDNTAPGPGPTQSPDLAARDGTLYPDPGYEWVVASAEIQLVGRPVVQVGGWRLWHLALPLRLRESVTGVYGDGWMGAESTFSQYWSPGNRAGRLLVNVTRKNAWGGKDVAAWVTVQMGPLVVSNKQPGFGAVTETRRCRIHSNTACPFALRTPRPPFRVRVTIDPTFVPAEIDRRLSDARHLGAKINYRFEPATRVPAAARGDRPCWQRALNDWYDGRLDRRYSRACLRDALRRVPVDDNADPSTRVRFARDAGLS